MLSWLLMILCVYIYIYIYIYIYSALLSITWLPWKNVDLPRTSPKHAESVLCFVVSQDRCIFVAPSRFLILKLEDVIAIHLSKYFLVLLALGVGGYKAGDFELEVSRKRKPLTSLSRLVKIYSRFTCYDKQVHEKWFSVFDT